MGTARGQLNRTSLNMRYPHVVALDNEVLRAWWHSIAPKAPDDVYAMSSQMGTVLRWDRQWTLCRFADRAEGARFMAEIGGEWFDKAADGYSERVRRMRFV